MAVTNLLLAANLVVAVAGLLVLLRGRAGPDLSGLATRADVERSERTTRAGVGEVQRLVADEAKRLREEVSSTLRGSRDSTMQELQGMSKAQEDRLSTFAGTVQRLAEGNEQRLASIRETVDQRLQALQEDSARKLDQMRATVEEKLQSTLERRLGESFKQVSERLEQVHRGLGEMQALADGVGDLKRVLTNVKARGTWGEVQLAALLEQVLSPEQYGANVCTKGDGREFVEFAVKLPGPGAGADPVWLPIDSKFPIEDYQRLLDAQDTADRASAESAARELEARLRGCAKDIREKYLAPPRTTDFGVMFLPTEGLYAEVLRRPGLVETLQREYRVAVAGPTTLVAFLNSLRMGFRTLAIEKRSSEVWGVLGQVKTEFGKFGDAIAKVSKKLQEASNAVDSVSTRSRVMARKLQDVEAMPVADSEFGEEALGSMGDSRELAQGEDAGEWVKS